MIENSVDQVGFSNILLSDLDTLTDAQLDKLPFGVVGLDAGDIAQIYNATESKLAGLTSATVIGAHFFSNTAQCMNNFMVAQRFKDEPELDAVINYVLTLRMRPTPVRLRLLQSQTTARHYVLIERRAS